jgi:hypothetical protein
MNFKQWLLEYEDDIDYDISDIKHSLKLPTRRTMLHDIGADVRDDFGKIFSKRMGSAMPSKGSSYNSPEDPIKTFNDDQYLVVIKDEPYSPTVQHPEQHIRHIMTNAIHKIQSDPEINRQLAASRCNLYIDRRKVETRIFQKDGKDFVRFTFRFKMNSTPGHNYKMSDKVSSN